MSMIPLRVFYKKTGRLKYISHLDMINVFSRGIQRGKMPVWYTQGYNPRIYISFPFPLSLGYGGTNECFDIRLVEEMPMEELVSQLNKVLPPQLSVHHVAPPVMNPREVAFADYSLSFFFDSLEKKINMEEIIQEILEKKEIIVEKRSKKGLLQIDIKPYISLQNATEKEEEWVLQMRFATGQVFNVNPRLFVGALEKEKGISLDSWTVLRTQFYNQQGEVFA